jgi:hypothetical protein
MAASKRWSLSKLDWRSIGRHFVYPVIAGGVMAAWELVETGVMDPQALMHSGAIAALAAIGKLVKAWATDNTAK